VGIIEFGGKPVKLLAVSGGSGANNANTSKFRVYFGQLPVL